MELKLRNIDQLFVLTDRKSIKAHINWIEPIATILLKALKNESFDLNLTATSNVANYIEVIKSAKYNPNKTFFPPKNFTDRDNIDLIASQTTKQLIDQFPTLKGEERQDFSDYINYSISEVMQNVLDHSQSLSHGYITAQAYPSQKRVQIAISDCGIGFLEALKYSFPIQTEEEAIIKALESNVTGSKLLNPYGVIKNAGIGLFALSKIVEHSKGNLVIISNNTLYKNIQGHTSIRSFPNSKFKGVVVGFEIFEANIEDYFETFKAKYLWKMSKEDEIF